MCAERLQEVVGMLQGAGIRSTSGKEKGADKESVGVPSVQLVAIGSGTAKVARGVMSEQKLDASQVLMLVDPQRVAYRALALHRGVVRTFTWRKPENAAGAKDFPRQCCMRGRLPMVNAGDPWSQGGVFVYGMGGGKPVYFLREESPGWPGIDAPAFVAAAKKAAATGAGGGGKGWFGSLLGGAGTAAVREAEPVPSKPE